MIAVTIVAAAFGATARYGTELLVARRRERRGGSWPWATFVVNVTGSLLAGLALGLLMRGVFSPAWFGVAVTGFCGGLTTFSTWMVDTVIMWNRRRALAAIGSLAAMVAAGSFAVWLGYLITG